MELDPSDLTVDLLAAGYASGHLSPVEVAGACLARIEARDPELHAFVGVRAEAALEAARASETRWQAGAALGPLDGVPASVKDLVLLRGWPTRKGSPHTDPDEVAAQDAPVARRLREAGAVVLGKTTTPEAGWKGLTDSPVTGVTRNPWDPTRTAGGSSGGAAVAAATGMAVLNIGSDGGGSVRMPAGFCGVVGLKPTHALVPLYPPGGSGLLSHLGPLTRTVRDTAHLMAAVAGPDPLEIYPTQPDTSSWLAGLDDGIEGMRVAYSRDFGVAAVDPQIAAAVDRTVELLAQLGATVEEVDPGLPEETREAFLVLWDAALGRSLEGVPPDRWQLSDPGLVATVERGQRLTAHEFLAADVVRGQATLAVNELLTSYDVLVSPQLPLVAFPVGSDVADPRTQTHWVDWTPFTYPINMTRHPAATVPVGLSEEGLPMAMQVVGRHFDDRRVLRVARAVERAQPFAQLPHRGRE